MPHTPRRRTRLLETEIRVLREESNRLAHDKAGLAERVKDNKEKIKLNNQLPYLVGNVVEVLDIDPEEDEEEDGASGAQGVERSCLFAGGMGVTVWRMAWRSMAGPVLIVKLRHATSPHTHTHASMHAHTQQWCRAQSPTQQRCSTPLTPTPTPTQQPPPPHTPTPPRTHAHGLLQPAHTRTRPSAASAWC